MSGSSSCLAELILTCVAVGPIDFASWNPDVSYQKSCGA